MISDRSIVEYLCLSGHSAASIEFRDISDNVKVYKVRHIDQVKEQECGFDSRVQLTPIVYNS